MEIIDFEFKKERKIGEFVQDFINLLKVISGHLAKVMLKLLVGPLSLMIFLIYYITIKINTGASSNIDQVIGEFIWAIILLLVIGMMAFGFGIEYFILLRDRRNTEFGARDVFQRFRGNFGKYLGFFGAAIIVSMLAVIPIVIVSALSVFIPIVGSFAVGIVLTIVTIWYFTAFMLYREGYFDAFNSFSKAFGLLSKNVFTYGVATYVIHFIFQSILTLMTIVPTVFFFLIGYNSGAFNSDFFDTFYGRILISVGGSMITVVTLLYYALSVLSYGIVYETAKELKYGASIFERINKLGQEDSDV